MTYELRIEELPPGRGGMLLQVLYDGLIIARIRYGRDFDEIQFGLGDWIPTDRLITGGGSEPLRLTPQGTDLLDEYVTQFSARIGSASNRSS